MTTNELIIKIRDKSNKQADIISAYYEAIADQLLNLTSYDWSAINMAIINRWSQSGLRRIKREAWKRYDNRYKNSIK